MKHKQSRKTGNIGYTQDEEKQNENITQYVLDITMRKKNPPNNVDET